MGAKTRPKKTRSRVTTRICLLLALWVASGKCSFCPVLLGNGLVLCPEPKRACELAMRELYIPSSSHSSALTINPQTLSNLAEPTGSCTLCNYLRGVSQGASQNSAREEIEPEIGNHTGGTDGCPSRQGCSDRGWGSLRCD